MKTISIKNVIATIALFLLVNVTVGYAQACDGNKVTVTLTNVTTTSTSVEFDITISNSSASNTLKLASLSGALIQSIDFANKGTFTVVTQPSQADFPNFKDIITAYSTKSGQLRWTNNPVTEKEAVVLPSGVTKKFARFKFVLSGTKISSDFVSKLKFQEYVQRGYTAVNANVYCNNNLFSTALANGKGKTSKGVSKGFIEVKINPLSTSDAITNFSATAYPNPFTEEFHLSVNTHAAAPIQIRVYDMLGKLIEDRTIDVSDMDDVTLGATYPSGIYNLNVSQGNSIQSVRIIRR